MRALMGHARHRRPAGDAGVTDGLAWALFLPAEPAEGGVVILHGAGSARRSPLRLRPRLRAGGLRGAVLRRPRPRRQRRADGRAGDRRRRRDGRPAAGRRSAGGPQRAAGAAGIEHGRLLRAGCRAACRARRSSRSARRPASCCAAGCRRDGSSSRPTRERVLRASCARHRRRAQRPRRCVSAAAAARRGRRVRPRRSTRASCTQRRPTAASSITPAAITARSSTTPSSRASRALLSGARSRARLAA